MSRERRGIALFAALALLALLGLITIGAFASTTLAQRTERLHQAGDLLEATADYALSTVLASPAQYGLADLPLGVTRSFAVDTPQPDRVRATVAATRFANGVLWLAADVNAVNSVAAEAAHRRAGILARFRTILATPASPLTARGGISLGDSVRVSTDTSGDFDCRVRTAVSTTAQLADSASYALTAPQLAALDSSASKVSSVRHVRGDTTITGGAFSGILIADGTITITGPFTVDGLLVARGRITSATGLSVRGAVMAYSADAAALQLANARIEYSPCAIFSALRTAFPPRVVHGRSWSDLRD